MKTVYSLADSLPLSAPTDGIGEPGLILRNLLHLLGDFAEDAVEDFVGQLDGFGDGFDGRQDANADLSFAGQAEGRRGCRRRSR